MSCNYCHRDSCCGECRPAKYGCDFDIQANPYDPSVWNVVMNGAVHRVKTPSISETLTSLALSYSDATLTYHPERGEDQVFTGSQLGGLIPLEDLRDVDIDSTLKGNCYELIFHKYNDCGDGCKSAGDRWQNWNVNSPNAKKNGIQYVRGANAYGCPVYLDVPTDTSKYWWGMWRPSDTGTGTQFGYTRPVASELPKDSEGRYVVLSQNPSTGQPIYGAIPNVDREYLWSDPICTDFIPASGFAIADDGGNSLCYYPHLGVVKISLDIWVTSAMGANTYMDLVVATIRNSSLWPSGMYDLPVHWVWSNNSDGAITPIMLRINANGQLLLSGYVPARPAAGKARYMVLGVDDMNAWDL